MFGLAAIAGENPGDNGHVGAQVRGYGFESDGTTDTLFRSLQADVFDSACGGNTGISGGDAERREAEQLPLAFDNDLGPVVRQQVTLGANDDGASAARVASLVARAQMRATVRKQAPFRWHPSDLRFACTPRSRTVSAESAALQLDDEILVRARNELLRDEQPCRHEGLGGEETRFHVSLGALERIVRLAADAVGKTQRDEADLGSLACAVGTHERRRDAERLDEPERVVVDERERAAQRIDHLRVHLRELEPVDEHLVGDRGSGCHRFLHVRDAAHHEHEELARRDGAREHELDGGTLAHRVRHHVTARDGRHLEEPQRVAPDARIGADSRRLTGSK